MHAKTSLFRHIDECALALHSCHENATCSDMVGGEDSYTCTCNDGHSGDGFTCVGEFHTTID